MSFIEDSCETMATRLITDATDRADRTVVARSSWRAAITFTL